MEADSCWKFFNCPEETRNECPAYTTNSGEECFYLAKDFCPKVKEDFKHCWECPWYKKVKASAEDQEELTA